MKKIPHLIFTIIIVTMVTFPLSARELKGVLVDQSGLPIKKTCKIKLLKGDVTGQFRADNGVFALNTPTRVGGTSHPENTFHIRSSLPHLNLTRTTHIAVDMFDVNGAFIHKLIEKNMNAGEHLLSPEQYLTRPVTNGVYFFRVTMNNTQWMLKAISSGNNWMFFKSPVHNINTDPLTKTSVKNSAKISAEWLDTLAVNCKGYNPERFEVTNYSADMDTLTIRRTNVIFFMMDELGYYELSLMGHDKLKTPNVDKMATEGVRYTQAMAGSAVCGPTRCVLLTGKHTGHCSVIANGGGDAIKAEDKTIGNVMQEAGYKTGGFGEMGSWRGWVCGFC